MQMKVKMSVNMARMKLQTNTQLFFIKKKWNLSSTTNKYVCVDLNSFSWQINLQK